MSRDGRSEQGSVEVESVAVFVSEGGARIYRIPLPVFPGFWGYAHIVVTSELVALVDVGSGFGESNEYLDRGVESVRSEFGESIGWKDLTHILITHGHIDHFGGLAYIRDRTPAPIGIHELDRRVLTGYEERLATVAGRLGQYLTEAGVTAEENDDLMNLYLLGKQLFSSQAVDFTFEEAGMQIGSLEITHVPGHTPGQVMMLVDDVLLSADHILERISPHLAPERLTLTTGLDHYLESLEKSRALIDRTRLVLGGHERPFRDLSSRIEANQDLYEERLARVLDLTHAPRTIVEIAQELFGETAGYHRLLALEEAGAYVEYLSMRGYLGVVDLESLERGAQAPIQYQEMDLAFHRPQSNAVRDPETGELDVRI